MSNRFSLDDLKKVVEKFINDEVDKIVNDVVTESKIEMEKKIKEATGKIAAKVFAQFNFRMNEREMVIHVNTKDLKL